VVAEAGTAEVEDSTAQVEDFIVALEGKVLDVASVEVGFSLALALALGL
jgi:hypothetical protein